MALNYMGVMGRIFNPIALSALFVPGNRILNVQEPFPEHFYWPDLDVDLTVEIIEHPERFPLKAK